MSDTTTATRTDDLLTDLLTASHAAKRQQTIVCVPLHEPSKWHEWIDLLLTDWMESR